MPSSGYSWQLSNIGGGGAFAKICGQRIGNKDRVYAAADIGGVYRGVGRDLAHRWDFAPKGSAHGIPDQNCYAVAIDTSDSSIVYAGCEGGVGKTDGIIRSVDDGLTWTTAPHTPTSGTDDLFNEIQVSRFSPNNVYAVRSGYKGTTCQVLSSGDRGATFYVVYTSTDGIRFLKLLLHPANPTILYAVSGQSLGNTTAIQAAYKSIDSGVTWNRIATEAGLVRDMAVHPVDPTILFITGGTSLDSSSTGEATQSTWKSTDSGATWTIVTIAGTTASRGGWLATGSAGPGAAPANSLTISSTTAQTFIALINDLAMPTPTGFRRPGVYLSLDDGASWAWKPSTNWGTNWKGAVDKFGMYKGNTYGSCNTISTENYSANQITRIFWASSQFCFISEDMGVTFDPLCTWTTDNATYGTTGLDNIAPVACSWSGNTVYAGCYDLGVLRSVNSAQTWKSINDLRYGWHNTTGTVDELGGCCLTVLADPGNPLKVWASLAPDPMASLTDAVLTHGRYTLIRSTDGGDTWTAVIASVAATPYTIMGLALDPDSTLGNRTLYVTRGGDVWRSTDDGQTWALFFANGGMRTVAAKGNTILMGGENGLYVTLDGGATTPTRTGATQFPTVALTDTVEKLQYKGVHSVLLGSNGAAWFATYYNAGTTGSGLWITTNSGATWTLDLADNWSRQIAEDISHRFYHTSSSAAKGGGNQNSGSTGLKIYVSSWENISTVELNDAYPFPWSEFCLPICMDTAANPRILVGVPGLGYYLGQYSTPQSGPPPPHRGG